LAARAAGTLSASTPPLKEVRYLDSDDRLVSVNTVQKIKDDDKTLNINADYANSVSEYDLSQNTSYYAGDKKISFFEREHPHRNTHKPSLLLKYKDNTNDHYLVETFQAKGEFVNSDFDTETTTDSYMQRQKTRMFTVQNYISSNWNIKKAHNIRIGSTLEYMSAPKYDLSVVDRNNESTVTQEVGSNRFLANLSGSYFRNVGGSLALIADVDADYEHNTITSELLGAEKTSVNSYSNDVGRIAFTPAVQYFSNGTSFVAQLKPTVRFFSAKNRLTGDVTHNNKFELHFFSWFSRPVNAYSTFRVNINYNKNIGDVVSLLTSPIMRTYRTENANSGIISESSVFTGLLYYEYKHPVKMWFANGSIDYTHTSMNTLSSQFVSTDNVAMQALVGDNTSESLSTRFSVTKELMSIHSKIKLGVNYTYSRNTIMQQNELVNYYGNSYTVSPSINMHPWSFVELNYDCSYSKSFTRYIGKSYTRDYLNNNVSLKIYPVKKITISGTGEFVKRQISDESHKSISIFDAGISYRLNKIEIRADVRNILNTRTYSYSLFNGIDAYTYDFGLRGREYTVTFVYRR
jgi:hypothetical protein